jgi:branched-chain amino acid transport system substrate-binding protein
MRKPARCVLATAIATAVAFGAAACSSSDKSRGANGSSASTAAAAATTGAAPNSPGVSGNPVHIVSIDDASDTLKFTDVETAVNAVVKAVNASGGVKGRPLEWTICTTKGGDQNLGGQCARDAVADKSVVAIVGEWSQTGTQINPVIDAAGMANIGLYPQAATDYAAASSFPVSGGTVGIVGGMVTLAADQLKAKKIGLAYTDSPQGAALQQLLQPIAQAHGAQITATTAVPAGAADLSSNVQATAANTDAVALSTRGVDSVKYVQSAQQQSITTPLVGPANFDAALIDQLPNGGSGMYFSDSFLRQGPGFDRYKSEISTVDASQVTSLRTLNTWVAAQAFLAAAKSATSLDRVGILAAMKSLTAFDSQGVTPVINFTKPVTDKFPRLFNDTVTYNKMDNKALTPVSSEFHHVLSAG